jgi:hypothetical protein
MRLAASGLRLCLGLRINHATQRLPILLLKAGKGRPKVGPVVTVAVGARTAVLPRQRAEDVGASPPQLLAHLAHDLIAVQLALDLP